MECHVHFLYTKTFLKIGSVGEVGPVGFDGEAGHFIYRFEAPGWLKGVSGDEGAVGKVGNRGESGDRGVTGRRGDQGLTGRPVS